MRSCRLPFASSELRPMLLLLLACAIYVSRTAAHSWLECTDYRMDPESADAKTWNPSVCHGRARCGGTQMNAVFGQDTGLDEFSTKCQCPRDSAENTAPVARYTPGQRVCLAYPPKNHVAAPCTNEFIPDSGVRITRSSVNPTSDDSVGTEYSQSNGQHQPGQIDYKGFQHCPNFCDNKEGALCTMCFELESDLAPGSYTFKRIWAFNTVDEVYTTCWEATVGGSAESGGAPSSASVTPTPVHKNTSMMASPTSAPPTSSGSTPSITPTVTTGAITVVSTPNSNSATASTSNGDEDCDDELAMPDDDCDDDLDMAGGDEIGGDADPSLPGLPSGDYKIGNTYGASNPSGPSAQGTPASDGDQEHENGNGGNGGGQSYGNGYGGGGGNGITASSPAPSQPETAVGSPSGPPRSQHGYHRKWHNFGRGNGQHQQHSNSNNYGGDESEDPDCALPIAGTKATPANVSVDGTPDETGQDGESANAPNGGGEGKEEGGAPSKPLMPADDTPEPDCEDELPMPDAATKPNDTHGQGKQYAPHPGDSYSFNSAAQPESDKAPDTVAASVLPYPSEY